MWKLISSVLLAFFLYAAPTYAQVSDYADPPAESGKAGKAKSTKSSKAKSDGETKAKTKREPTKGQLEARERQKQCGAEWRAAKAAGKLEKGATWPKFWSACNARLKAQRT